jgi:hypothetical protein
MAVQEFQQQQQAQQHAQAVEDAKRAVGKAQFVLTSKEPGQLVKTAFPEVWDQLEQMGEDPENFTPEKWREEASAMVAHYGPIAGVGPAGKGEPFTLAQGQTRFDANGNPVATVAAAPTDKDPNDKLFNRATNLRKEYESHREGFDVMRSAFENVKTAERGDAGDTQLVLNYMRLISPGIRVQPGERIDDAASVPGVPLVAVGMWNKLVGGGKLNDSQRKEIRSQAGTTYKTQERLADEARDRFSGLAKLAGVDPKEVVGDRKSSSPKPTTNKAPADMTDAEILEALKSGG